MSSSTAKLRAAAGAKGRESAKKAAVRRDKLPAAAAGATRAKSASKRKSATAAEGSAAAAAAEPPVDKVRELPAAGEAPAELPQSLQCPSRSRVAVDHDQCTSTVGQTSHGVGWSLSSAPIRPSIGLYYFEVTIKNPGRFRLGIAREQHHVNQLLGESAWGHSYALSLHSGFILHRESPDQPLARKLFTKKTAGKASKAGTVIGCLVDFVDRTISFTFNGEMLGVAFRNVNEPLDTWRAAVCVNAKNSRCTVRFAPPFRFDYAGAMARMATRTRFKVARDSPAESIDWYGLAHRLVDYEDLPALKHVLSLVPEAKDALHAADGAAPLHLAVRRRWEAGIVLLVERGASIYTKNGDEKTPLDLLADDDHDLRKLLLSELSGSEFELFLAVEHKDDAELERALAADGVNLDARARGGDTVLVRAVKQLSVPMTALILESRADINLADEAGDTPLHHAIRAAADSEDAKAIARLLVSKAARLDLRNAKGESALDLTDSESLRHDIKNLGGLRDVMISFSHQQGEFAVRLRDALEARRITCWLDDMRPSGIDAGTEWRQEIGRGISKAKCLVFAASPQSLASEWCRKEIFLAKKHNVAIFPIWVDKCPEKLDDEAKSVLYTRQFVDFSDASQFAARIVDLSRGLKGVIAGGDAPEAGSAPAGGDATSAGADGEGEVVEGEGFVFVTSGAVQPAVVAQVRDALRNSGLDVRTDLRAADADVQKWMAYCTTAIAKSARVVAVVGESPGGPPQALRDLVAMAEEHKKPVQPVFVVAPPQLDPSLEYSFAKAAPIAFVAGAAGFDETAGVLASRLGGSLPDDELEALRKENEELKAVLAETDD